MVVPCPTDVTMQFAKTLLVDARHRTLTTRVFRSGDSCQVRLCFRVFAEWFRGEVFGAISVGDGGACRDAAVQLQHVCRQHSRYMVCTEVLALGCRARNRNDCHSEICSQIDPNKVQHQNLRSDGRSFTVLVKSPASAGLKPYTGV